MQQRNKATGRDASRQRDTIQQRHAQVDVTSGCNVEMQRKDTTTNQIKWARRNATRRDATRRDEMRRDATTRRDVTTRREATTRQDVMARRDEMRRDDATHRDMTWQREGTRRREAAKRCNNQPNKQINKAGTRGEDAARGDERGGTNRSDAMTTLASGRDDGMQRRDATRRHDNQPNKVGAARCDEMRRDKTRRDTTRHDATTRRDVTTRREATTRQDVMA